MRTVWSFQAVDTFFFRDGTPFNAGESPLGPVSQFPPSIETLQGAIRTQLARLAGWKEGEPWPEFLGTPDSLGRLRLTGPFLEFGGNLLFPVPALLLKRKDGSFVRLAPSKERFACDLGSVHLPALPLDDGADNRGAKNVDRAWLTGAGLAKVLAGGVPDEQDVIPEGKLWHTERHVGIELNPERRAVKVGMLYTGTHVRPVQNLAIKVQVDGADLDSVPPVILSRLGGENRQARTQVFQGELALPPIPDLHQRNGRLHFTVTLLTPGYFGEETRTVLAKGLPGVPGSLVTACIGKIAQQGGWDMARRQPRPLMPIVPAGSTWFYTAPASDKEQIVALHGQHLSRRSEYGYGHVVIGTWRDYH